MKEKYKLLLYGIFIMVATIVSILPLRIVNDISDKAFSYAVISWALGILIGMNIIEFIKIVDNKKKVN